MLIDAFTYFNEKELVELRLKYLDPIVDYFVIIESNVTFTGKKKEWNFPEVLEKNLKKFSNKIKYHQLKIDLQTIKNEEAWIIDGFVKFSISGKFTPWICPQVFQQVVMLF